MNADQRYFFVHLQKTAGTALLKRLRHQFEPEVVYPTPAEQGTPEAVLDVDRLRRRDSEPTGRFQVVTGHFPLCVVDLLDGPFATFTVLRDPVERVLSFLRHQREVDPRFADRSLEHVYADPVSTTGLVDNHMVKMLSLSVEELSTGALTPIEVDDARVEQARVNLRERVQVVGLQDRFDQFCDDLEQAFSWDLGPPVFMNRTAPVQASQELRERVALRNQADLELYGYAEALWAARHPPLANGPGGSVEP